MSDSDDERYDDFGNYIGNWHYDENGDYIGPGALQFHMEDAYGDLFEQMMLDEGLDPWEDEPTDSEEEFPSVLDLREMMSVKKWEETGMEDSHLLNYKSLDNIEEPAWSKLVLKRPEADYQDLYSLASQLVLLLSAWEARVDRYGGDWENLEQRDKFMLPFRGSGREGEEDSIANRKREMWSFLRRKDLNVEHRARYSVGRLMDVLKCKKAAEQFTKEVNRVKRLVHSLLLRVLEPCLPSLPYTAMVIICREVCGDARGLQNICLEVEEGPSRLLERKYVLRLYQTLDSLYRGVREIMFKHATKTASLWYWYPDKFRFLRNRLGNTISLLKTLHKVQEGNSECVTKEVEGGGNLYAEEPEQVTIHQKEDYEHEKPLVKMLLPVKRGAMVSGGHLFLPVRGCEGIFEISVQNLASGQVDRIHVLDKTALSDLKKGDMVSLFTPLAATESLVAVSLSFGYPTNVSSRDIIFVFNWVNRQLVWKLEVPYSSAVQDLVRRYEEEYELEELDDDDLYLVQHSLNFKNQVKILLCCSDNGSVYMVHCESLSMDDSFEESIKRVRLYKLGVEGVYKEFGNIYLLDCHRGLVIYRQLEKDTNPRSVVTTLLDIDSGVVVKREILELEEDNLKPFEEISNGNKLPIKNISRLPGPRTILEYGEGTLTLYVVDKEEQVQVKEYNLKVLMREIDLQMHLHMMLVGDGLLHVTSEGLGFSPDIAVSTMTRHLLVDLTTQPRSPADVFVAEEKVKDYIQLTADMVAVQGNTLVLLSFFPDNQRPGEELLVKSTKLIIGQTAEEVVKVDEDMASQIWEQRRLGEGQQGDLELRRLCESGGWYTGVLINWKGSFGFIKIDQQPGIPNIFVHISDVKKPRPFLRPGQRLEFMVEVDQQRNKPKAVSARVTEAPQPTDLETVGRP